MTILQPVRGTHDLLGEQERRHRMVVDVARTVAGRYGFQPMATPILEFTDVFVRTIGETSDIVSKEMYCFTDRSGDSITLRPENTAGVARAVVSNGLTQSLPLRFFYDGPMFRHERPQKGRLRQFHQIGTELIGAPQPLADVEVIACGADILRALGIWDRVRLTVNSLGDGESRAAYRTALVEYFLDHRDKISKDSQNRLQRNPLRILDSKDPGDREVILKAPILSDYLTMMAKDFFDAVKDGLNTLGIAFDLDMRLVRGLDYYCHTAFEFVTESLGAQGTVMGGGRYDGLIEQMGGPPTAGVGWAAGIERLAMMIAEPPAPPRPVALAPLGAAAENRALSVAHQLRQAGVTVDLSYGGTLKKRLARADKIKARLVAIIGDDELALGQATIRDLDNGQQRTVALDALVASLTGR